MREMTTRFAPVALCAVMSLPALASPAVGGADCKLKRYASVDFSIVSGKVLLPVTVESTQARMWLNTASSISVIWLPMAGKMGLTPKPLSTNATIEMGSQRITQYAVAKPFMLGSARLDSAEFLLPQNFEKAWSPQTDANPIVGAIGMDFFSKIDFELDFKNRKLNLYSQDHCPGGAIVYWADSAAPVPMRRGKLGNEYFPLELEGKKVQATLSTGSPSSVLSAEAATRLYGFTEQSAQVEQGFQGTIEHYRMMSFTTPGLSVSNSKIFLGAARLHCTFQPSGKPDGAAQYGGDNTCLGSEAPLFVGMNVLEKLHLYFATKENVLYVTTAEAHRESGESGVPLPAAASAAPVEAEFSAAWQEGWYNEHETADGAAYVHGMVGWLGPALGDSQRQCGGRPKDMTEPVRLAVQLNLDGSVQKAMLSPSSPHWECVKDALAKKTFPAPPREGFWTSTTIH